ncbi:MAG: amino acid racemase [Clostridia bacterium]|nr:amino acid racemase [Clostridia bacterium]
MSSAYFYELLTAHTKASCDQEHMDIVISSRATTPDRTGYILGKTDKSPIFDMIRDTKKLIDFGADLVVIPCNTAHYFYDELAEKTNAPILNIIEETVRFASQKGAKKLGILATSGTIHTNTYQKYSKKFGIECIVLEDELQNELMEMIYSTVKSGKSVDTKRFLEIGDTLLSKGADFNILGCTELSLIDKACPLGEKYIDSLKVLAKAAIEACGKEYI